MEREAAATSSGDNIIGYQHERSTGDQRQQGAIHLGEAADSIPPSTLQSLNMTPSSSSGGSLRPKSHAAPTVKVNKMSSSQGIKARLNHRSFHQEPGQHQKATPVAVAINLFTIKFQRRQQRQLPGQFTQAAASQAPLSTLAYVLLNQSSNYPSKAHPP